jgi:hypothetical protein
MTDKNLPLDSKNSSNGLNQDFFLKKNFNNSPLPVDVRMKNENMTSPVTPLPVALGNGSDVTQRYPLTTDGTNADTAHSITTYPEE